MDIREQLRQARHTTGFSRHKLAMAAGLGKNALANMDAPEWNPTAETIEAIRKVLTRMKSIGLEQ